MSKTRFYRIWKDMNTRCNNPNYRLYKNYGGRGISICDRWEHFENFKEDMYPTYDEKLSIDRIDNNGNYCKENCKWSTDVEQNRNRRMFKLTKEKVLEIRNRYKYGNGRTLSKEFGVTPAVISEVVNKKRNYANY